MHDPNDIFRKAGLSSDIVEFYRQEDRLRRQLIGLPPDEITRLVGGFDAAASIAAELAPQVNAREMRATAMPRSIGLAFPPNSPALDDALVRAIGGDFTLSRRLVDLAMAPTIGLSDFQPLATNVIAEAFCKLSALQLDHAMTKSLVQQMAGIGTGWASVSHPVASVYAFTHLNGFSETIRSLSPLSFERASVVEAEFGAYDTAFVEAESAVDDEQAEATYTDAGRNPSLVAFPRDSYPSILQAAGWVAPPLPMPAPLQEDGTPVDDFTFDASDLLLLTHVEAHLRDFVFRTLATAFGLDWTKKHVQPARREEWEMRRDSSMARGFPRLALFYYADFSELKDLICKRDLWAQFFVDVFGTKELFVASMIRLHAIRLELTHSRSISNTARLRLEIEANTILGAIRALS